MTCMMVIKKWVKYYYQVLFNRQIVHNQLQYWFDLLKIVTYAQPKKIIRHVSNHAIGPVSLMHGSNIWRGTTSNAKSTMATYSCAF